MATEARILRVTIHTDGAAFDPDPRPELARILRSLADRIEQGDDFGHYRTIHDVNGNDVGRIALKTAEEYAR